MRSSAVMLFVAVVGPVLALACNAAFGIDELRFDGPTSCSQATECPGEDGPCSTRTCDGGSCGVVHTLAGEPCPGGSCDGAGSCVPTGGPCQSGDDCQAGRFCVDGRCCPSACDGICEACDVPGSVGLCTAVPAGNDPADECVNGACDGQRGCFACGNAAPPTGTCPLACNDCTGDVCHITCINPGDCESVVTCPEGWPCAVSCVDALSCFNTTVVCPTTGQSCDVDCQGSTSCGSAIVECGGGPCALTCSNVSESCADAQLYCGMQQCSATCLGTSKPQVSCGGSCGCLPCP
jgi:hypothetical protein